MKMKYMHLTLMLSLLASAINASQTPPSVVARDITVPGATETDANQVAYINEIANLNNQISDLSFKLKDASPAEADRLTAQIRYLTIELKEKNLKYQKSRLEQSQTILDKGETSLIGTEKEYQDQVIVKQQNDIARLEAELDELKSKKEMKD